MRYISAEVWYFKGLKENYKGQSSRQSWEENQAADMRCLVGVLPGVSVGGVMEGAVREEWKGEGRARQERGSLHKRASEVCVHALACAEITYLQRLNKTSLCQTIQGMAGHSLWGAKGCRETGQERGTKRRRKRDDGEGRGWGGEGEKDSSVSLTWQDYQQRTI